MHGNYSCPVETLKPCNLSSLHATGVELPTDFILFCNFICHFILFFIHRKFNLRELKILQREEQKQGMLLMAKIRRQWDAQEQRFEQELQVICAFPDSSVNRLPKGYPAGVIVCLSVSVS